MKKLAIVLPVLVVALVVIIVQDVDGAGEYKIPSWVKNLAKFWVNDRISDEQFGSSISYLIEKQVIKVPIVESLKQENVNLKRENSQLKNLPQGQNNEKPTATLTPQARVPIQPIISVATDRSSYAIGEIIRISGEVGEMLSSKDVIITIKNSQQTDVYSKTVALEENQKFLLEVSDASKYINKTGKYSVTAQYHDTSRKVTTYIDIK